MKVIDFFFKICYSPFQKVEKGGRLAAIMILTPSLTFVLAGILISLISILSKSWYSRISSISAGILMATVFAVVHFQLLKTYIKNARNAGAIKYPVLYGLMIPILIIGSSIFYVWVVNNFG